jgi:sarcosine oxidase
VAVDAEVVVVGAGITGAAAAHELARGGSDVVLLEQFALGHDRGSSHGTSRIFRLAYPEARYVRLAQRALESWRELEAAAGTELIVPVGSLDLGPIAVAHARALAGCGVRHELLYGNEVSGRWPIAVRAEARALFQPDGGVILAARAHALLLDGAREAGAEIRGNTRVTGLARDGGAVSVETTGGETLRARAVVVAAGAWAQPLLDPHGVGLAAVPTRETVVFFDHDADGVPTVIDDDLRPTELRRPGEVGYALAAPPGELKVGLHHSGPVADPDDSGEPDPAICEWAAGWVARRFPGAHPAPRRAETCLYTNRPDESFVLERHGNIVVGAACSGHGFKFGPLHGRVLAALAREAGDA